MPNEDTLCNFEPADFNACGSEWQKYKRLFEIHLDANGLYGADGREKVRQLLKCMGQQSIATYNSFTWAAAIPAIPADEENGVEAEEEIPGESKYNLQTVFSKFEAYFGVHQYKSIKRQIELTNAHIKSINDSHSEQQIHQHTVQDRTRDVTEDVEQREIEDTARGVAEPIDTENAEHFTGIATPVERKAILRSQNCANTTVKQKMLVYLL